MSPTEKQHLALTQMIPPMLAAHGLSGDDCCAVIFASIGFTINHMTCPLEDKITLVDQLEAAIPELRRQLIKNHPPAAAAAEGGAQ